jgi:hypothetical protein
MTFKSIEEGLGRMRAHEGALLRLGHRTLSAGAGALFPLDFYVIGALKRASSVTAGFILLVEARNLVCAGALLRMQLETAFRFFGLSLVANPHDAASQILGGTPLRRLKSRDGQPLHDTYLVEQLAKEHPWVSRVYKETSKFVHFTEKQIFAAMTSLNDDERTVQMLISADDAHAPEAVVLEILEAFDEATLLLGSVIESWRRVKGQGPSTPEA